jgi:hypothetical protein
MTGEDITSTPSASTSTLELASRNTDLAVQRTCMSADRTLMSVTPCAEAIARGWCYPRRKSLPSFTHILNSYDTSRNQRCNDHKHAVPHRPVLSGRAYTFVDRCNRRPWHDRRHGRMRVSDEPLLNAMLLMDQQRKSAYLTSTAGRTCPDPQDAAAQGLPSCIA